jgi:hypothetical protein
MEQLPFVLEEDVPVQTNPRPFAKHLMNAGEVCVYANKRRRMRRVINYTTFMPNHSFTFYRMNLSWSQLTGISQFTYTSSDITGPPTIIEFNGIFDTVPFLLNVLVTWGPAGSVTSYGLQVNSSSPTFLTMSYALDTTTGTVLTFTNDRENLSNGVLDIMVVNDTGHFDLTGAQGSFEKY